MNWFYMMILGTIAFLAVFYAIMVCVSWREYKQAVAEQEAEKAEYERAKAAGELPPDDVRLWPRITWRW